MNLLIHLYNACSSSCVCIAGEWVVSLPGNGSCHCRGMGHVIAGEWVMSLPGNGSCHCRGMDHVIAGEWIMSLPGNGSCHCCLVLNQIGIKVYVNKRSNDIF